MSDDPVFCPARVRLADQSSRDGRLHVEMSEPADEVEGPVAVDEVCVRPNRGVRLLLVCRTEGKPRVEVELLLAPLVRSDDGRLPCLIPIMVPRGDSLRVETCANPDLHEGGAGDCILRGRRLAEPQGDPRP